MLCGPTDLHKLYLHDVLPDGSGNGTFKRGGLFFDAGLSGEIYKSKLKEHAGNTLMSKAVSSLVLMREEHIKEGLPEERGSPLLCTFAKRGGKQADISACPKKGMGKFLFRRADAEKSDVPAGLLLSLIHILGGIASQPAGKAYAKQLKELSLIHILPKRAAGQREGKADEQ